MKIAPAVLVLAVAMACATPQSLMQRPPIIDFTTAKSPKEVATIVSKEWGKEASNFSTNINGDGFTISITSATPPAIHTMVVIDPVPEGSRVRMFQSMPSLSPGWIDKGVNAAR